jgi:transposase InsO family protein
VAERPSFHFIENFYKLNRRHSSLSYFTPEEFENLQLSETQAALA